MLFLSFLRDTISGYYSAFVFVFVLLHVCVCECVHVRDRPRMMPSPEGFECGGDGSSWKGVTNSKGAGVHTCSANCAADVAAALFRVEVRKVASTPTPSLSLHHVPLWQRVFQHPQVVFVSRARVFPSPWTFCEVLSVCFGCFSLRPRSSGDCAEPEC